MSSIFISFLYWSENVITISTNPADPAILFELPIEQRLAAAIKLLGFDPLMLSGEAGHA